jgi:hypothetical protein
MLGFLVLLLFRGYSVDASCDKSGFQIVRTTYWRDRDDWGNSDEAFSEFAAAFNSYYLGIKGSYVAQEEGTYYFRVCRGVGDSSGLPDVDYASEGQITTISSAIAVFNDGPYTFYRYFRYPIFARYAEDNAKADSWMELQIVLPSGTAQRMNAANGGRACQESGCEDMTLSRTVWSCRPGPPSRTRSPTPPKSPSRSIPLPSVSATPAPTPLPPTEEYLPGPFRRNAFIMRVFFFAVVLQPR